MQYRFKLQPYKGSSSRYKCPGCGFNKQLTRYIDTETGEQLSSNVGKCNRDSNCSYHYTPKQFFTDNPDLRPITSTYPTSSNIIQSKSKDNYSNYTPAQDIATVSLVEPQAKAFITIPIQLFHQSLKRYDQNNFTTYLQSLFGKEITEQLTAKYYIGTSKHWNGASIFWQIDSNYTIRTGKIMLYNSSSGKRVKDPYNHIHWVHSILNKKKSNFRLEAESDVNLKQCLFGEHLIKNNTLPIAIVESEKTAIIASVYLPQFLWLAAGSKDGLNLEKCKVLQGRNVTLFPDLNAYQKWQLKSEELSGITNFSISNLLESKATEEEKKQGFDLADYLIQFDYNDFQPTYSPFENNIPVNSHLEMGRGCVFPATKIENPTHGVTLSKPVVSPFEAHEQPIYEPVEVWDNQIADLESFFASIKLPTKPILINPNFQIPNPIAFVKTHLIYVNNFNGNKAYLPYLNKLISLKSFLNNT